MLNETISRYYGRIAGDVINLQVLNDAQFYNVTIFLLPEIWLHCKYGFLLLPLSTNLARVAYRHPL